MASSERTPSASLEYRADIDGLRAVAVLSAIGYHAFPEWIPGGFIGVNVFFVISGYLISGIILTNLENGTFSFREFYARRVKRIFPSLALVLSACMVLGWLFLLRNELRQLGKHVMASSAFLANFALWSEAGYFDDTGETKPLLHLWSLGVEEQFYLVWPFILWRLWPLRKNLPMIVTGIGIVSFAINLGTVVENPTAAFFSPLSRFWELMLGGMLSIRSLRKADTSGIKAEFLAALGLLLILTSAFLLDKDIAFPGWWALLPTIGAALIISAGETTWINGKFLGSRVMVGIGLVSYSFYLWHWPLLSFAHIVQLRPLSIQFRIVMVSLSLALAGATYKAEKSIRMSNRRSTVGILCALMVGVFLLGYKAYTSQSLPNNVEHTFARNYDLATSPDIYTEAVNKYVAALEKYPDYVEKLKAERAEAVRQFQCHVTSAKSFETYLNNPSCLQISDKKKNILIIGDSHAGDLFAALSLTHKEFNFLQATGILCLTSKAQAWCNAMIERAAKFAVENKVDAVIIAGTWAEQRNYKYLAPLIGKIKAAGRKVAILGPPLKYSGFVYKIIARWPGSSSFEEYMDSYIKSDTAASTGAREFAKLEGSSYIDYVRYFCKNGCKVLNAQGQLYMWDASHLTLAGARYFGELLYKEKVLQTLLDSEIPLQMPVE